MVNTDKILNKVEEEYEYLTGDEEVKRLTELRNRAIRELKGSYHAGLQEGMEKGIEKGMIQEKLAIAKIMLDINYSIDEIIKCTDLSKENILALTKER